ncbi:hypothetical protein BKA62DRAFT_701266 [Auriculariales sp. MPI-PUGE-AT-0066]|nr:hypothetical protein BKA62DRAFT_701266 [Auriculariales sp. MPI-PUGE-AT-0066]
MLAAYKRPTLLLVFFFLTVAKAAFTRTQSTRLACIQVLRGVPCFFVTPQLARDAACNSDSLESLLQKHIDLPPLGGSSTAYYNLFNQNYLGNATYSPPNGYTAQRIAVCHTGGINDETGRLYSTCRIAMKDDDHQSHSAEEAQCGRIHRCGEAVVAEGCCRPFADPGPAIPSWTTSSATILAIATIYILIRNFPVV